MKYSNQTVTINKTPCIQVNKPKAQRLFDAGKTIYMHPCNMVLNNPWQNPVVIHRYMDDHSFSSLVNSFEYYMAKELGSYANFFVKEEC